MKLCKVYDCSDIELTRANSRIIAHRVYLPLGFTPQKLVLLFYKYNKYQNP